MTTFEHKFKKMKISGSEVKISYNSKSVDGGLVTKGNQPSSQFFLAGNDKIFHAAKASIDGDNVVLKSDSVANPVAVRYAFTNMAVVDLFNKAGLPAEPFRTDDWVDEDKSNKIKLDYKKLNEGK